MKAIRHTISMSKEWETVQAVQDRYGLDRSNAVKLIINEFKRLTDFHDEPEGVNTDQPSKPINK